MKMKASPITFSGANLAPSPKSRPVVHKKRRPELLRLPIEAMPVAEHILKCCTESGRPKFSDELFEALESPEPDRQMWNVLESWNRTVLVISDPVFSESLKAAEKREGELMTIEELKSYLGV